MNVPYTPALRDALLRTDLPAFVTKVFHTLNPGRPFRPNWHLEAIVHCLEEVRQGRTTRLAITLPPRSLKSMIVSVAYPAFLLGQDPTRRIVCVSSTAKLAEALARDFRIVVNADWYRALFPALQPGKDTADEFTTTRGGLRLATSIDGTLTGRGGDLIIVDDPLNAQHAASEVARKEVNDFYGSTLYSRLDDKQHGAIIIVMQRLHVDDLVAMVLQHEEYVHLNLPAIAVQDETIPIGGGRTHHRKAGDILHPERESARELQTLKRNLGSAAFQAQYQQDPMPLGGNLVKSEWLLRYDGYPPPRLVTDFVLQSWDTAAKGGEQNDYSVCTTWYVRGAHRLLVDVVREHLDYPELVRKLLEQHRRHRPDALLIEDHGSGTALIQDLRANHQIGAVAIRPEHDKVTRLSIVSPQFEAGWVLLPRDAPWLGEYIEELLRFPETRFKDQVDSTSQALSWLRDRNLGRSSFEFDFGDLAVAEGIPNPDWLLGHVRPWC